MQREVFITRDQHRTIRERYSTCIDGHEERLRQKGIEESWDTPRGICAIINDLIIWEYEVGQLRILDGRQPVSEVIPTEGGWKLIAPSDFDAGRINGFLWPLPRESVSQ